jgi:hypothetical protein
MFKIAKVYTMWNHTFKIMFSPIVFSSEINVEEKCVTYVCP